MPLPSRSASLATFPIDWGGLAPLRLTSRAVAEGVYAGMHRSVRKGAGVEFGGQRPYVPGDDLRFFDRRALLRHDRLMVREFETETDRALWLCVDATASMAYRGRRAPGAKLAYAALIAAAMARVALATGDPVGLAWLGGAGTHGLPAMAGREAFERIVGALESTSAAQDLSGDLGAIERALAPIAKKARRGAVILLLSDLLDLAVDLGGGATAAGRSAAEAPAVDLDGRGAERALGALTSLTTGGRTLLTLQILDPAEAELDFEGNVRLRALEGDAVVEADADAVRAAYRARLEGLAETWSRELASRGGRLLRATSASPPTDVVRSLVRAVAEVRR